MHETVSIYKRKTYTSIFYNGTLVMYYSSLDNYWPLSYIGQYYDIWHILFAPW